MLQQARDPLVNAKVLLTHFANVEVTHPERNLSGRE
jgi:hypothetical protein